MGKEAIFVIRRRDITDLMRDMIDDMERSFEELCSWDFSRGLIEPLVYISESEDNITITADLPYVNSKENIEISATEDSIELKAEVKRPIKFERWGVSQRKVQFVSFRKVINLRSKIDPKKVEARFEKGILRIFVPKLKTKYNVEIK
jgi:HSP20 family protein